MTSPVPRLGADVLGELDRRLAPADAELAARYPGDPGTRQPVHTVYVPADQMTPGLTADWGGRALAALADHAPTAAALAGATGLEEALVAQVLPGVLAKLETEPVEDLRLTSRTATGPGRASARTPTPTRRPWPWPAPSPGPLPRPAPACASAAWRRPPGAAGCGPSTCSWALCWTGPSSRPGSWSPCPR